MPTLPDMERMLREAIDRFPPAARAEMLHVLMLPDFDRVERIGLFWAEHKTWSFAEFLIDLEEDDAARAVVVGMLRERSHARWR